MIEPESIFPDSPPIQLWRERQEPAAVTIRCGRGKKRCDRIAYIYETPGSAVVVFHQHTPDRPVRLTGDAAHRAAEVADLKRVEPGSDRAMQIGRADEGGTVVCLERDDYWADVVEPGCRTHLGLLSLDRSLLLDLLRKARRRPGRTFEHVVS